MSRYIKNKIPRDLKSIPITTQEVDLSSEMSWCKY